MIPGESVEAIENTPSEILRLIEQFLAGEPDAIKTVAGWARVVATHRAWGFETPEDIVQATLLALVQNLRNGKFRGELFKAYVRRIAKNMCVTHYRRKLTRGERVPIEEIDRIPEVSRPGMDPERRTLFNQVLEKLDAGCRQIVLLAYVQGYSRKEIGERLGISEEAARAKLFRCVRTAKAVWGGGGDVGVDNVNP